MTNRTWLRGFCAIALAATALSACGQPAAPPAPVEKLVGSPPPGAPTDPKAFPQWAFPGPHLESVPGSDAKYSEVMMFDRTNAVDWFPSGHPPMPDSVKGKLPVYACGFCHLPQGSGRSENAALAGLPAKYIIQQVADFKSGKRKTPDPKFGAAVNMEKTVAQVADADVEAAANYYASLKYEKHVKLVESADVPQFVQNAFVYVISKNGPRAPLGNRIIEGPDDFRLFEMRDPNMTFTAYVPVGAVARGAELAKGNDERVSCESCHGPGLKGGEQGPPIAGRLPTSMFRQVYAIQTGARAGPNAAQMKPVVENLTQAQIIDLVSYVASLEP